MITNYFKIARRVWVKQRLYNLLNAAGLFVGLTTSILLVPAAYLYAKTVFESMQGVEAVSGANSSTVWPLFVFGSATGKGNCHQENTGRIFDQHLFAGDEGVCNISLHILADSCIPVVVSDERMAQHIRISCGNWYSSFCIDRYINDRPVYAGSRLADDPRGPGESCQQPAN